jgi:hypothetical protein
MGYTDEWGEWQEGEPPAQEKPALWVPKQAQASIHKQAQVSTSKHPSPGTPEGRVKGGLARRQMPAARRKEIAQKAARARWR